jgi:glycosyltransferase involved in cell wall biosynthesis
MPKEKMTVLMLAFELPPYNSGGLGEACLGLTKSLSNHDVNITFMLPEKQNYDHPHMKIIFAHDSTPKKKTTNKISIKIRGYDQRPFKSIKEQVEIITSNMVKGAAQESFDLVHAHDWMTAKAGVEISKITGKPLVFQIHSTEIDRAPEQHVDKNRFTLEKYGIENADKIVVVSKYTQKTIEKHYNANPKKIGVVYNATDINVKKGTSRKLFNRPIVLSLGRITYQKGIDHLLKAARKVVDKNPKTLFVIVGDGDMYSYVVELAATLGLSGNIVFTGFLRGEERETLYANAKVFVMPSISEPFGLVAVEAAMYNIPTIVSNQSGVAEVLKGAVRTDYWDTNLLSKRILAILNNKKTSKYIVSKQTKDLQNISWDKSAKELCNLYHKLV